MPTIQQEPIGNWPFHCSHILSKSLSPRDLHFYPTFWNTSGLVENTIMWHSDGSSLPYLQMFEFMALQNYIMVPHLDPEQSGVMFF